MRFASAHRSFDRSVPVFNEVGHLLVDEVAALTCCLSVLWRSSSTEGEGPPRIVMVSMALSFGQV